MNTLWTTVLRLRVKVLALLSTLGLLVVVCGMSADDTNGLAAPPAAQETERDDGAVFNVVAGRTKILSIKRDGAAVKKGDLVCELDASRLREQLANQVILTESAAASLKSATLTREVAEIAVEEFLSGMSHPEIGIAKGELALARSELARARDRLEWSKRMKARGSVTQKQVRADEFTVQRSKLAQEQAELKMAVLQKSLKNTALSRLRIETEKAKSDESIKKLNFDRLAKLKTNLERQIASCKIVAPSAGRVSFLRLDGRNVRLEAGELVGERQFLFRVVP